MMLNYITTQKRFNCLFFVLLLTSLSGCKGGFGGSTDAGLSRLSISPGNMEPAFAKETYEYTVTLAMSEDSIVVNARVTEDDASMQLRRLTSAEGSVEETFDLSDDTDSSSISVATGANYFDITVTSGNESVKTYAITVTRQDSESTDTSLSNLDAEGMNVTFDSETGNYQGDVNYFVNSTRLKATLSDPGARFTSFDGTGDLQSGTYSERQNLTAGETKTFSFRVTASDLSTIKDYSLAVTRKTKDGTDGVDYTSFLKADNAANGAKFGSSIDVFENLIAVGAPFESSDMENRGAAYFFRPESDTWAQEKFYQGEVEGAQFGYSVAVYGSFAAVGAPGEQNGRGKVYVYRYENESWSLADTLSAGDTNDIADGDRFGSQLAINGPYLAVSAEGALDGTGKVYIFAVDNFSWSQKQIITSPEEGEKPQFGVSLVFNAENELVIGAPDAAGSNSEEKAGTVYIYKRSSNSWALNQTIRASTDVANAEFGKDLDAKGNTLAVGTPGRNSQGSVIVFKRTTSSAKYAQDEILTPETTQAMAFGSAVALFNESMLAVGAPAENKQDIGKDPSATGNTAENAGAVYVFGNYLKTGNTNQYEWTQEFYLKAKTDTTAGDRLGEVVAAHDTNLIFGIPNEDTDTAVVNASQNNDGIDVGGVFVVQ